MELTPNMYARTKKGIRKIIKIDEDNNYYIDKPYINDFRQEIDCITNSCIICEPSHNIIDLIEVGDYVNGYKVYYCYCADEDSTGLFIDTEKGRQWLDKPSQVKTIVTKEQFESMSYKVGD